MVSLCLNPGGAALLPPLPMNGDLVCEPRIQQKEQGSLYCAGEVRILVLDDDQAVCRVIQAALSRKDFAVETMSEPSMIEERLRSQIYHVIILDYVIPGVQSEQVLDWVREYQPEASIIVVTAFPSIDSALNCLRARTYDYLTKQIGRASCRERVCVPV